MLSRRRYWPPFLLALALFLLAAAGYAAIPPETAAQETPPDTINIRGATVNGTAGGLVPANMPLTLHAIDPTAGRVATAETVTDGQGNFRFAAVAAPAGGSYVLVMDYAGMRYNSLLSPADLAGPATMTVYETTRDLGVIRIDRHTMVLAGIEQNTREIAALELLNLTNRSDRTLLPELTNITNPNEINFLRFSLPPAASNLDVQSNLPGGEIITIGNGFALTAPVLPGRHQINYTYTFPYADNAVAFNQRLLQGAAVYQVLVPERLPAIQIAPLQSRPPLDIDGTAYRVWETRDLPPRQGVMLAISNLPQPGPLTRLAQTAADPALWQTAIPIMLAIALAAALLYGGFQKSRPTAAKAAAILPPSAGNMPPTRRQDLTLAIAALDETFDQGQLDAAEYQSRRAELLTQLRQAATAAAAKEPTP